MFDVDISSFWMYRVQSGDTDGIRGLGYEEGYDYVTKVNARGGPTVVPMPKPPGGPGGPTHLPPNTPRKDFFFNSGAKIQIYAAKIQIYGDKIQSYIAKTQICGAKIQILDPKFKYLNFGTTQNLPLCTRKTPSAAGLTPTHPPLVLVKN